MRLASLVAEKFVLVQELRFHHRRFQWQRVHSREDQGEKRRVELDHIRVRHRSRHSGEARASGGVLWLHRFRGFQYNNR